MHGLSGLLLRKLRLPDAYQFCGGPLPSRGLVLGQESALFRVVRLGGHKVRKAHGNASDVFNLVVLGSAELVLMLLMLLMLLMSSCVVTLLLLHCLT